MKKMSLEIINNIQENQLNVDNYIMINQFNDDSVNDFYKKMVNLNLKNDVKIIPVLINSYGGSVHNLLAMLDIINSSNKPVATIGLGKIMSAGIVLLAAGSPGYRYVAENADIMIHELSTIIGGKNTEIQNETKNAEKFNSKLLEILSKYSKKDKSFFKKKLKQNSNVDWYISPKNAKQFGLVDHIGIPNLVIK